VLLLPLLEIRADVLDSLGGLGDFLSLDTGFFLLAHLLETFLQDVEQSELYRRANLRPSALCDRHNTSQAEKHSARTRITAPRMPSSMAISCVRG
jgi:hypothetical protein